MYRFCHMLQLVWRYYICGYTRLRSIPKKEKIALINEMNKFVDSNDIAQDVADDAKKLTSCLHFQDGTQYPTTVQHSDV